MDSLVRLRASPTAAFVGPLMGFMLVGTLAGWVRIENSALPWYERAPEHWVYPLQTLICGGMLWWFRGHYRFSPWAVRGLALAFALGLIGIGIWVLPAWVYENRLAGHESAPAWWKWLGLVERREGYDPSVLAPWPFWEAVGLAMRFVRMVIVVPLVEELFWRGFLMRFVVAGDRQFTDVAFGTHAWKAFWIVTLGVTVIHNPPDMLAAFVWGSLMYLVAVRTRGLGACVVMHAVGNLALGLYVLKTEQWGFW